MSNESSAEVQREAEAERAELVSTLDQLRENLKPANMVDEVLAGAKVSTAEITDRLWQTARANPVASVFIGMGAAMILGVGQQLRSHAAANVAADDADWGADATIARRPSPVADRTRDGSSTFSAIERQAETTRSRVTAQLRTVASRAASAASQIADSAFALQQQASRTASASVSSARQGLGILSGENAMNQYSRSRDQIAGSMSRLLDEQPLVLAALGIAVGAAIGAAIPSTEAEGRLMGDTSQSLKTRAQELAQQELAHLKDTATATLGDLKQTAIDHGVSTDNVKELIQDAGAKVRDAAADVANHAADKTGLNA